MRTTATLDLKYCSWCGTKYRKVRNNAGTWLGISACPHCDVVCQTTDCPKCELLNGRPTPR